MERPDDDPIADALASRPPKPGAPCRCCRHPRRAELDHAIRRYHEARRIGAKWDGTGELPDGATSLSWSAYHKFLRRHFGAGVPSDSRCVARHALDCAGVDVREFDG